MLIVGKTGQVAQSLAEALAASEYRVTTVGRPEIDLCEPQSATDAILAARPDIVINAAAYTAVDRAEDESEKAFAINATGAEAVAAAAAETGAPIIHLSTDYVFDGQKRTPYIETDLTAPTGIYGESKLLGEHRVAAANPRHVILRTAWVFSPFGSNFVKTMLRLNQEKPEIRVVDDQHGNPTYAPDLAEAIRQMIDKLHGAPQDSNLFGTFHAVNADETTWFGFASAIIEGAAKRGGRRADVHPIGTRDYPTRAKRPAYSVLSTDKLAAVYDVQLRPWSEALSDCLDRLVGSATREPQYEQRTFDRRA
ncbi:MAG: dTDP-4-dehydrorhamnose reductase [Proteobacteria bacterium]|nr:dTDP-4-dehydrorhamnose reductase [Pseudomonadota bacterium]